MCHHRLLISEADFKMVQDHVDNSSDERMAFLYCGRTRTVRGTDWLVRAVDLPGDEEYRHQSPARVCLPAQAVVTRVIRARGNGGFIDVHSHPFSRHPRPSSIDEKGAEIQLRVLGDLAPGVGLLRIIFGKGGGLFAEVHDPVGNSWLPLDQILIFGKAQQRLLLPLNSTHSSPGNNMEGKDVENLDTRTAAVVGDGIEQLREARVLVIGAGGVGSAVLAQVAGLVRHIDIVDPDHVELHNLPRLHQAGDSDIGRLKAQVLASSLRDRFERLKVRHHAGEFPDDRSEEMFREADFVFCCPDHHAVRWAASSLAARTMRPLVEVGCGGRRGKDGAISALGYHVRLQVPGGPCLACNGLDLARLEDPASTETKRAAGYIEGDGTVRGELVTLTTRAAADAVDTFVRYLTGYTGRAPTHLYFDALRLASVDLSCTYSADPSCSLCGSAEGSLQGAGDELSEGLQILPSPQEVCDVTS